MKRKIYIVGLFVLSLAFASCEDDALLDETPSENASGSYGKSTFTDVPTYEELINNEE